MKLTFTEIYSCFYLQNLGRSAKTEIFDTGEVVLREFRDVPGTRKKQLLARVEAKVDQQQVQKLYKEVSEILHSEEKGLLGMCDGPEVSVRVDHDSPAPHYEVADAFLAMGGREDFKSIYGLYGDFIEELGIAEKAYDEIEARTKQVVDFLASKLESLIGEKTTTKKLFELYIDELEGVEKDLVDLTKVSYDLWFEVEDRGYEYKRSKSKKSKIDAPYDDAFTIQKV